MASLVVHDSKSWRGRKQELMGHGVMGSLSWSRIKRGWHWSSAVDSAFWPVLPLICLVSKRAGPGIAANYGATASEITVSGEISQHLCYSSI
jgi:hypothetical protein